MWIVPIVVVLLIGLVWLVVMGAGRTAEPEGHSVTFARW